MAFPNIRKWYAMSSPYGREMQAVETLSVEADVETFVPMERFERMVGQKSRTRKITQRPVVRNLLFVKATELRMRQLKQDYNMLLQFKVKPQLGGGYVPVIVPDKQMEDFMRLYNCPDLELQFYKPEEIEQLHLRPNAKVRIEDGMFAGVEGYYQQVKGARGKRFVVKIEGMLACAGFLTECRFISIR